MAPHINGYEITFQKCEFLLWYCIQNIECMTFKIQNSVLNFTIHTNMVFFGVFFLSFSFIDKTITTTKSCLKLRNSTKILNKLYLKLIKKNKQTQTHTQSISKNKRISSCKVLRAAHISD